MKPYHQALRRLAARSTGSLTSISEDDSEAFAMSAGQLARQRSHRSVSSGTRSIHGRSTTPSLPARDLQLEYELEPCAATASTLLFAQDRAVVCLTHDTLKVERRFEKHKEKVVLIAVDNVSERGSGRLVVSCDADKIAIIWDIFTGDEIARFSAYDQIRVASWMKNGSVAFGTDPSHIESEWS